MRTRIVMWVITAYITLNCPRIVYFIFSILFFGTRFRRVVAYLAAFSCFLVFLNGIFLTRRQPEVKTICIRSSKIPKSFDEYRIVQLSDIHLGGMMFPESELSRLLSVALEQHPDAVAFTGDLVVSDHIELNNEQMKLLRLLRGRDGMFAVQGNHDIGVYSYRGGEELPKIIDTLLFKQRNMGWTMLLDSTIYLRRGADSISLSGTAYSLQLYSRKVPYDIPEDYSLDSMYRQVPKNLFNITLTHLPMMSRQIIKAGYGDLILSGHVHAMQMKLSLFGYTFSPAQWLYKHWSGLYDIDGHKLYVNDGYGSVGFFLRLGVKPEVSVIILHSEC
ncbi:MAG: metallophosphoesterase [Alistipes sp.]|nr:metallophosphoesterase [Candidatus Alistipes equi]